jgi:hypothetical protein
MVSDHPVLGGGTAKVKLDCCVFGNLNSSDIHVSVLCDKTASDRATEVQWATLEAIQVKPTFRKDISISQVTTGTLSLTKLLQHRPVCRLNP